MWEKVLSRLEMCRESSKPNSWVARCPAHDDHRPSLSIRQGDTGCLILKCFAGCNKDDILLAVGLEWKDLFPEKDNYHKPKNMSRLVDQFVYEDETGTALYRVNRYEPKRFTQERCVMEGGKRTWQRGTEGVRKVLWQLPRLLKRTHEAVLVLEGERKVRLALQMGLLATCCAGGSNSWEDSFSKTLSGRHVIVVPDNDEPGMRMAYHVMGSCIRFHAASIRLAVLPNLPPKGSLPEWLAARGLHPSADSGLELLKIVNQSPLWKA